MALKVSDYTGSVLLDANENAYGPSLPTPLTLSDETFIRDLNRYPDPHQRPLKQLVCNLRNSQSEPNGALTPDNLSCGVGSGETIDAVIRVFCTPGKDKLLICTPACTMSRRPSTEWKLWMYHCN